MATLSVLYGLLILVTNDGGGSLVTATPRAPTEADGGASGGDRLPLVLNTWLFADAAAEGFNSLSSGGSSIDAVVAGCSLCEEEQCDGSVGYGNHPDENGETTLDAMVMDGNTHNVGAVGSLRGIKSAIAVARYVLDHTTHTLLVGSQATDFALEMGFQLENLTTEASANDYNSWKEQNCQPNYWVNVTPSSTQSCGPYSPEGGQKDTKTPKSATRFEGNGIHDTIGMAKTKFGGIGNHDTIGMIAIDADGNIACGTSTNGASHKIPGRVGDSPIAGSGCYADKNVGAAAATGDGDVMMRFLPSLVTVEKMRLGIDPQEAAVQALDQIIEFYPEFQGGLVVASKEGNYTAVCHGFTSFQYSFQVAGMTAPEVVPVTCSY